MDSSDVDLHENFYIHGFYRVSATSVIMAKARTFEKRSRAQIHRNPGLDVISAKEAKLSLVLYFNQTWVMAWIIICACIVPDGDSRQQVGLGFNP